ncbi:MAG: hypothetical protein WAO02_10145 [Verrucomicrobiia bacterium]
MKAISYLTLALLGLLAGGCASANLDPASARPGTGYVDFYAVNADDLSWDITDAKRDKKVFYEFDPVKESILRLAFKPGRYQLRVTFLNHVILKPGVADVEVRGGMVTPVTVTLLPAGTALVETRSGQAGSTYYGRYGRRTRIGSNEAESYEVSAETQPSVPFQPRAQMSYAVAPKE